MSRAVEVKYLPVAKLQPYAGNARTHTPEQIEEIAGSIRRFGFTNPVLLWKKRRVIAGHGRLEAAKRLGLTEVPTIELSWLTEGQCAALTLADNRIAANAGWDAGLLTAELRSLKEIGEALEGLGFSEQELAAALSPPTAGLTDPDLVPPTPEDPVSRPGDLWILGKHRILCGDSTVATDVERVLGGVKPHLMVTDPPYGVEYDAEWREKSGLGSKAHGKVENDTRADWREAWALFPGEVSYVWHAGIFSPTVAASLEACGFEMRALIIWVKSRAPISRGHYHHRHEPCWYSVRKGKTGHWTGDRKQNTAWDIDTPRASETGHSTQKPMECMKRPIENNSSQGQAIYEPFSGSGTTIIAAETTGRCCIAIELSPAYVDVAVIRWQAFTGLQATLDGGETFDALAKKRPKKKAA